jgi:hypothetical protein
MKTKVMKLTELKENKSNPRVIKDDKFNKLVKSIKEFPKMLEMRPIVVDKDNVVLGGNMRLKACKDAGLTEVPVLSAEHLTPEEQQQFIVKDNLSYGEWDWDALISDFNMDSLTKWGMDVPSFNMNLMEPQVDYAVLGDKMNTYVNNTIKQIVLYYETSEYIDMLNELDSIGNEKGFDDNSSVVEFLVKYYKSKGEI